MVVYNGPMTDKTKAFMRLISIIFGTTRHDDRPFRNDLIWAFLRDQSLRHANTIELNERSLRITQKGSTHEFRWDQQPLSADELDALKQVLTLKLSDTMNCVTCGSPGNPWMVVCVKTEV